MKDDDVSIPKLQDMVLRLQLEKDALSPRLLRMVDAKLELINLAVRVEAMRRASPVGQSDDYIEGHKHGMRDCAEEVARRLEGALALMREEETGPHQRERHGPVRVIHQHDWKHRLDGYFHVATCRRCGAETIYLGPKWTDYFPFDCQSPGPHKSPFAMREAEREDS